MPNWKKIIYISIALLVLANAFLLLKRYNEKQLTFITPVAVGSVADNEHTASGKETLFVFVKPECSSCALYKDSLITLFNKYKNHVQFIGLCNPKYWDEKYLKSFGFKFIEVDNNLRKSLHLAVTPQFILVENKKVTFSHNFLKKFQDEFSRLKKFLETKYDH